MPELFVLETERVQLTWSGAQRPLGLDGQPHLGRCALITRRNGLTFDPQTWRAGVPSSVGSDPTVVNGPLLFEETAYSVLLTAKGPEPVSLEHRDPNLLRNLSASQDTRTVHGTVNFRSQVGRSRFSVEVGGQPEFDFEVEVSPSKLDYETDYAELTAEVQSILKALVLEFLGSTFERAGLDGSPGATDLEWTLVLSHIVDDLERALQYIAKRPIRGLRRQSELMRADRIRRSDSRVRRAIVRGHGTGPMESLPGNLRIRRYLDEHRALPTLDTPEHRWLATRLGAARRRLASIHRKTRSSLETRRTGPVPPRLSQALEELESLEGRLSRLLRLEPLEAAEGMPPQGFSSLQLQGAPGYREAFHACTSLSRGLNLSGGPVELSLKDLHLLYEYWCYLAVLKLVADVLDEAIPVRQLLVVEQNGLRVRLEKGRQHSVKFGLGGSEELSVTYSPTFTGDDYLLPQKPDISITLSRRGWPLTRLVLDAKYRLDDSSEFVKRMGAPGPPFDAINVLHRYRDAILEREPGVPDGERGRRTVVEGAALFPLDSAQSDDFKSTRMWSSLERLGIGALPFLPSEKRHVRDWLTSVLSRSGWEVADQTIPSAGRERVHEWRQAASEAVLVGVLRKDEARHLKWIYENGIYYAPFTPSQARQLSAKWVALYRRAANGKPGAVCIVAPVTSVEIRSRRDVPTPWTSSRDDDCVVLHLGSFVEIDKPAQNLRSELVGNRWTSKLGLSRAERLEELLLETEPEWRLYDELRQRGIDVGLRPGRPQEQGSEDPRGRAWIIVGDTEAQYRGMAGWRVRRGGREWDVETHDEVQDLVSVS